MPGPKPLFLILVLASLAWTDPKPPLQSAEWRKLGFEVTQRFQLLKPTAWERENLNLAAKGRMKIKSRFASPLGKGNRYRFTLDVEEYTDSTQAIFRLRSIFVKPPKLRPEESKVFPLQRAYRTGSSVVIVKTDVAAYLEGVDALRNALMQAGFTADPKARAALLDSLGRELKNPKR